MTNVALVSIVHLLIYIIFTDSLTYADFATGSNTTERTDRRRALYGPDAPPEHPIGFLEEAPNGESTNGTFSLGNSGETGPKSCALSSTLFVVVYVAYLTEPVSADVVQGQLFQYASGVFSPYGDEFTIATSIQVNIVCLKAGRFIVFYNDGDETNGQSFVVSPANLPTSPVTVGSSFVATTADLYDSSFTLLSDTRFLALSSDDALRITGQIFDVVDGIVKRRGAEFEIQAESEGVENYAPGATRLSSEQFAVTWSQFKHPPDETWYAVVQVFRVTNSLNPTAVPITEKHTLDEAELGEDTYSDLSNVIRISDNSFGVMCWAWKTPDQTIHSAVITYQLSKTGSKAKKNYELIQKGKFISPLASSSVWLVWSPPIAAVRKNTRFTTVFSQNPVPEENYVTISEADINDGNINVQRVFESEAIRSLAKDAVPTSILTLDTRTVVVFWVDDTQGYTGGQVLRDPSPVTTCTPEAIDPATSPCQKPSTSKVAVSIHVTSENGSQQRYPTSLLTHRNS